MTALDNPDVWLDNLTLDQGEHTDPDDGMCWMEAISFANGEDFSDHPDCVSPVIAAVGRTWQDGLDDADRQRLIKPLFWEVVGTRTDNPQVESDLAWMAADWLVRVQTPTWLRFAGLIAQAELFAGMPALAADTTPAILPTLETVRLDAAAAGAVAWDAAWAAAGTLPGAAARDAAWDALHPVVVELQAAAGDLLVRMCVHAKARRMDLGARTMDNADYAGDEPE